MPNGQERIKEALKHGFTHAIVPKSNAPKTHLEQFDGIEIIAVERLDDAIEKGIWFSGQIVSCTQDQISIKNGLSENIIRFSL